MLTTVHGSEPGLQLLVKHVIPISDEEAEVRMLARPNWPQNWCFWADGKFSEVYWIPDAGDPVPVTLDLDPTWETHIVYAFPMGYWTFLPGEAGLDLIRNLIEVSLAVAIDAEWDAPVHFREAYNDSDQFANWALVGLQRFTNCNRVDGVPTQARLEIVLSTDGGVHTLTLSAGEQIVASGSRTGNGQIVLAEQNSSGLSGTVDLTYSGVLAAGVAWASFAWPKSYELAEGAATLAMVKDDGYANRFAAHLDADADGDPLGSGVHSIKMNLTSDTNQQSGYGTPADITLGYRPPSPSSPAYLDGNWTNTRITFATATPAWTAETAKSARDWVVPPGGPAGYAYECTQGGTTGATPPDPWPTTLGATVMDNDVEWTCRPAVTYRVYDSELDAPTDHTGTPTAAGASGGTVTVALPSLAAAAAGLRRLHIAALCDGVEDLENRTLEIEYSAAGAVIDPGPNAPAFRLFSISGRTLTLSYEYDPGLDEFTPVNVQAWLVAEGDTPDWSSPDIEEAIAAADTQGRRLGTVALTAPSDGHYRWAVRFAEAGGGQSPEPTLAGPRWLGTGLPNVPTPDLLASA